jgi:D-3-phosphoglycerate dehydrogenase
MADKRVLIASVPFGQADPAPLRMLDEAGVEYAFKPGARRLNEDEVIDLIGDAAIVIAGLDPISARVMDAAPNLGLIARLGIGLDTVDLAAARSRGIAVTYTPDAPAAAVAELTIGLMLAALRSIPQADRGIRSGQWPRILGRRLGEQTVGVLGVGRVGQRVIRYLSSFGSRILASDPFADRSRDLGTSVRWVEQDTLLRESDVVSLHLPLTSDTRGLISSRQIDMMKPGAIFVNTSRGELVSEADLVAALRSGRLGAAALDVFNTEPYSGELASLENTVLTSHLGSQSADCRTRMEIEAVEDVLRFLRGEPLRHPVPRPAPSAASA